MSDWTNPDVTPVSGPPGERADVDRPTGSAGGQDPFGSRPTARRRGWIRVGLGGVLVVAGIVAVAVGIVQAVSTHDKITGDAVVRSVVRDEVPSVPETFTVPAGDRTRYSVYLLFDGVEDNSEVQELAVRDTGCTVTGPGGAQTSFRGARQTVAATIGDAASVGTFWVEPGRAEVVCSYTSGTRSSERRRPGSVPYVVTAGAPSFTSSGVVAILAGVTAALLGGFLAIVGWRRRS